MSFPRSFHIGIVIVGLLCAVIVVFWGALYSAERDRPRLTRGGGAVTAGGLAGAKEHEAPERSLASPRGSLEILGLPRCDIPWVYLFMAERRGPFATPGGRCRTQIHGDGVVTGTLVSDMEAAGEQGFVFQQADFESSPGERTIRFSGHCRVEVQLESTSPVDDIRVIAKREIGRATPLGRVPGIDVYCAPGTRLAFRGSVGGVDRIMVVHDTGRPDATQYTAHEGVQLIRLGLLHEDLGLVVLERNEVRLNIPFAMGWGPNLSAMRIDHPPLSPQSLVENGISDLRFLTSRGCSFSKPTSELHIDEVGLIRVELPPCEQGVVVRAPTRLRQSGYEILAELEHGPAFPLVPDGDAWKLLGVPPGRYELTWIRGYMKRAPIRVVNVVSGAISEVIAEEPVFREEIVSVDDGGHAYYAGRILDLSVDGIVGFRNHESDSVYRATFSRAAGDARVSVRCEGILGSVACDFIGRDEANRLKYAMRPVPLGSLQFPIETLGELQIECVGHRVGRRRVFRTLRVPAHGLVRAVAGQRVFGWLREKQGNNDVLRGVIELDVEAGRTYDVELPLKDVLVENRTDRHIELKKYAHLAGVLYGSKVAAAPPGVSTISVPRDTSRLSYRFDHTLRVLHISDGEVSVIDPQNPDESRGR